MAFENFNFSLKIIKLLFFLLSCHQQRHNCQYGRRQSRAAQQQERAQVRVRENFLATCSALERLGTSRVRFQADKPELVTVVFEDVLAYGQLSEVGIERCDVYVLGLAPRPPVQITVLSIVPRLIVCKEAGFFPPSNFHVKPDKVVVVAVVKLAHRVLVVCHAQQRVQVAPICDGARIWPRRAHSTLAWQ